MQQLLQSHLKTSGPIQHTTVPQTAISLPFNRDHQVLKKVMECSFQNETYLAPWIGEGPPSLHSKAAPFAFPNLYFIPSIIFSTGDTIMPYYSTYESIHMCINKRITLPMTTKQPPLRWNYAVFKGHSTKLIFYHFTLFLYFQSTSQILISSK